LLAFAKRRRLRIHLARIGECDTIPAPGFLWFVFARRVSPSDDPPAFNELAMMFRASFGLPMLLLLSIGCRSNNEQYDLMQRELRLQEDRIYQLEGYIEQYQAMLDNHESEPELIGDTKADPMPTRNDSSIERRQPSRRSETPETIPDSLAPPDIDLGEPDSTAPSLRKPVTEELLPDDPLPALPDFEGARSPTWGRRRLSERPLFQSAVRPLQRLRERAEASPIWQPNRPSPSGKAPANSGVAPRWNGETTPPRDESTRTAEAPSREEPATDGDRGSAADGELKQAGRPLWRPTR
jgi:hypothetical protein